MELKKTNIYKLISGVICTLLIINSFELAAWANLRPLAGAEPSTYAVALEMRAQGWFYIMPEPKSPQARWGNKDGRLGGKGIG